MLSSRPYFLRVITILGVLLVCLGTATSTDAQMTSLIEVIAVVKNIPAGRAFLQANGISSSTDANAILAQIQEFPLTRAIGVMTVLGQYGARMGANAPGDTFKARVVLSRAREKLATEIFLVNGKPEVVRVAELAKKYAAYDHSGTVHAPRVVSTGIPADYKGVVRLDLTKIKPCDGQKQIAVLVMFETGKPALSATVVYGDRETVTGFISDKYLQFTPCEDIEDAVSPVATGDKYAVMPARTIHLDMSSQEYLKLASAALAASPPLTPPPPPPPSSPPPSAIAFNNPRQALSRDVGDRQCKLEDVCVSSEETAKMKITCGSFGIEASTEGAKVSLSQGPMEIAFKLPGP